MALTHGQDSSYFHLDDGVWQSCREDVHLQIKSYDAKISFSLRIDSSEKHEACVLKSVSDVLDRMLYMKENTYLCVLAPLDGECRMWSSCDVLMLIKAEF